MAGVAGHHDLHSDFTQKPHLRALKEIHTKALSDGLPFQTVSSDEIVFYGHGFAHGKELQCDENFIDQKLVREGKKFTEFFKFGVENTMR